MEVAFICNQKNPECDVCSYPECRHTKDIRFAKNFIRLGESKDRGAYYAEVDDGVIKDWKSILERTCTMDEQMTNEMTENQEIVENVEEDIVIENQETMTDIVDTTKKVEDDHSEDRENSFQAKRARRRFYTFLRTVFNIANLSGLRVESRIVVRDLRTGEIFE